MKSGARELLVACIKTLFRFKMIQKSDDSLMGADSVHIQLISKVEDLLWVYLFLVDDSKFDN